MPEFPPPQICQEPRKSVCSHGVGVLASLVGPLAEAGVNILAFSTYDTDYLLVPGALLEKGVRALKEVGHIIDE